MFLINNNNKIIYSSLITNQSTPFCVYAKTITSLPVRKELKLYTEDFFSKEKQNFFVLFKLILLQYLPSSTCSINTFNSSQLILTCPNGTQLTELPFSSDAKQWLSNITSFLAQGENNTRGPFTTIPTNICWMSQLTVSLFLLDFYIYHDINLYWFRL